MYKKRALTHENRPLKLILCNTQLWQHSILTFPIHSPSEPVNHTWKIKGVWFMYFAVSEVSPADKLKFSSTQSTRILQIFFRLYFPSSHYLFVTFLEFRFQNFSFLFILWVSRQIFLIMMIKFVSFHPISQSCSLEFSSQPFSKSVHSLILMVCRRLLNPADTNYIPIMVRYFDPMKKVHLSLNLFAFQLWITHPSSISVSCSLLTIHSQNLQGSHWTKG